MLVNMLVAMKSPADPDVRLLAGAADPTRLAMIRQLAANGTVCACDFTGCCGVRQPTVSHHLRVLRETGWVSTERRGSWIYYRLNPGAVARFASIGAGFGTPNESVRAGVKPGRALPVVQPSA
jgi:ArsR family transcriptional regulator, arsenate/arsenite/antimonite-responsive transcriptional repressor